MSLARAFTVRRNKASISEPAPYVGRAASQRSPNSKPIQRSKISLPVALVSTTNMLSYEAPDIVDAPHAVKTDRVVSSSGSSVSDASSGDESDRSSTSAHSNETAATSINGSAPSSPEPNHLSCYFKPGVYSAPSANRSSQSTTASSRPSMDSPSLPQRAPSHSKKAHVLSHKRSVQRFSGRSTHERETSRSSIDFFSQQKENVQPAAAHPFGKELEQLHEVAEEFGTVVRDHEADQDREIIRSFGLGQFCAAEYMNEISGLYSNAFEEDAAMYTSMAWI